MTAVLTAGTHRLIPAGCDCEWDWTGPGQPWVRITPSPRCKLPGHYDGDTSSVPGLRQFWTLKAREARLARAKAEAALARAEGELAALGAPVVTR